MEEKILLARYGKYYDFINNLGRFKIDYNIKAKEIGIKTGSGIYQTAFKEMREINFKGTMVDYLRYISTEYFLSWWKQNLVNYLNMMDDINQSKAEKKKITFGTKQILNGFISNIYINQLLGKCMIKLVLNKPAYLFESKYYKEVIELIPDENDKMKLNLEIFSIIGQLRFFEYIGKYEGITLYQFLEERSVS